MANITLLGASYTDVPAVDLPQTGGGTVRFYENGGGGSGYTRTVIVPQQTVTPTYRSDGGVNGYVVDLSNAITEPLAEWSEYIVTFNGTEYFSTATLMWGSNVLIGDVNWFWGGSDLPYPFGILYYNGECTLAVGSGDALTIKVEKLELTGSGGGGDATLITKTITANGTYSASDDSADGYSEVTVNVPSSAASSWTKVAETSYQVSTTSTNTATVATWATGHSEIWTSDKIVYVRVRDTAGKRAGYFYGADQFFFNYTAKNHPEYSGVSENLGIISNIWRYSTNGSYTSRYGYNTTGYGVYADAFYDDGSIRIRSRYNSSYSLTINGTYKVEVYLLNPPTGAPIFT